MSALDRIVGQVLRSLRSGRARRPGRRPYGGPPRRPHRPVGVRPRRPRRPVVGPPRRPRRPYGGPPRSPGRGAGVRGIVGTLRRLLRSGGRRY